ncbi:histone acetylation protein [Pochonia chlamydosporia 170]|uniref:histone acetyltransferase n=1 Tax=Pochonia chlamydosporia 170 TaxID=1380566 RepID=A0A179FJY7_METCM|nr:histone acetylation protein [Pochonia chlamydosporia 170]OAQ65353.1 histone acetylation protein [Pochonia chlamydosporia 170]
MATPSEAIACDTGLADRLRLVLPKDIPFTLHHVSTPPRKTDALYSAPPNERPDRTYCENHFLTVSIDLPQSAVPSQNGNTPQNSSEPNKQVVVLGIEIFIYTTAHSTTLFVSKADSTGYLPLLNLPKGTPSPIREVCAAFVDYLVAVRRRPDIPFIVSLFARSQGQYLFPGSVDHGAKHVLDDRGLIKWWCRVLDPLITSPPSGRDSWKNAKGYLVIPGLDAYETRAFIPRTAAAASSWSLTHPLERISHYTREFDWVPPRCLIPRFPDDPKSRFRDELDEEAGRSGPMKTSGSWKTVKTLDMFWEMMAYRQECSSGRMTGFIWVVFDDKTPQTDQDQSTVTPETPKKQRNGAVMAPNTTPRKLFPSKTDKSDKQPKKKSEKKKIKLKGPIKPRQPQAKTAQRNHFLKVPVHSPYYYWPQDGRGSRIVNETMYKRITELMLHLDFSSKDKAVTSSRRWTKEVGQGGDWGVRVVGAREPTLTAVEGAEGAEVNNLSGLVKRKRADTSGDGVNVLGAGLVKKKAKDEAESQPGVNVLTAGLVRKKPKAEE